MKRKKSPNGKMEKVVTADVCGVKVNGVFAVACRWLWLWCVCVCVCVCMCVYTNPEGAAVCSMRRGMCAGVVYVLANTWESTKGRGRNLERRKGRESENVCLGRGGQRKA